MKLICLFYRLLAILRLPNHYKIILSSKHLGQPLAHDTVIIYKQNSNFSIIWNRFLLTDIPALKV